MGVMPGVFLKPMEPAVTKTVRHVLPANTMRNTEANSASAPGSSAGSREAAVAVPESPAPLALPPATQAPVTAPTPGGGF
jgi:hypothetical protein